MGRGWLLHENRGEALTGVLVAGAILSFVSFAAIKMFSVGMKANRHIAVSADANGIEHTFQQMVDCDKTFALGNNGGPINTATDCQDTAKGIRPKALTLYMSTGNRLTSTPPSSGTFSPTDSTFQGSADLGAWKVRAYCDVSLSSLVIRVAQSGSAAGFFPDPLTKRNYDWNRSPLNPVVGSASNIMCSQKFTGDPLYVDATLTNKMPIMPGGYGAGAEKDYPVMFNSVQGSFNTSTGEFTANRAGVYQINAAFAVEYANWEQIGYLKIRLYKNYVNTSSKPFYETAHTVSAKGLNGYHTTGATSIMLAQGERIQMRATIQCDNPAVPTATNPACGLKYITKESYQTHLRIYFVR